MWKGVNLTRGRSWKSAVGLLRSTEASVRKRWVGWRRLDSNHRPTPRDSLAAPLKKSRDRRSSEGSVKKNDVWWRRLDSNQRPTPRDSLAAPLKKSRDRRSGEAIVKKNDV